MIQFTGLTKIIIWINILVEAPVLTAARHLDNVELPDATFTLVQLD